ncbi:MAG TPA: ROK family protein [Euzebyales bacterium]|nr:ROK family protein [Euzebyales bacterium]
MAQRPADPVAPAIGLDVGGTKIVAAVVDHRGVILSQRRVDTPGEGERRTGAMVGLVQALCRDHALASPTVGVGAAGLIDLDGAMAYAPNLDWRDYPLRARLEQALGLRVRVENDAAVAAWAEYVVGAGRDAAGGALMITLGTGVGGGLVTDGRLQRGAHGFAAEFGHLIIAEGGPPCPCGNRGCLEALASGSAIGRAAREGVAARTLPEGSALYQIAELTGADVTTAAQAGDEGARGVLVAAGHWLGVGIASLVNVLDPEIVIIGGGVIDAGALILDSATAAYHERVVAREHRDVPPVVRAGLGDDAGVIGAALLGAAVV